MIESGYADRSEMTHVWQETVALDYGQFDLLGSIDAADDDSMTALESAQNGPGIGQVDDTLVVLSPHQNNFEMPLRVEVWTAQPVEDLEDWQEVFDASIAADFEGIAYDSPTVGGPTFEVPEGRYRVRISGRGFVAHGWPGSTSPGDEWRIQLWPSDESVAPARLQAWDGTPSRNQSDAEVGEQDAEFVDDPVDEMFEDIMNQLLSIRDAERDATVQQEPGADYAIVSTDSWFPHVFIRSVPRQRFVNAVDQSVYNLVQTRDEPHTWSDEQLSIHRRLLEDATAVLPTLPPEVLPLAQRVLGMLDATERLVAIQLSKVVPANRERYPQPNISLTAAAVELAEEIGRYRSAAADESVYLDYTALVPAEPLWLSFQRLPDWIGPDGHDSGQLLDLTYQARFAICAHADSPVTLLEVRQAQAGRLVGLDVNWRRSEGSDADTVLARNVRMHLQMWTQSDGATGCNMALDNAPKSWRRPLKRYWTAALVAAENFAAESNP